ncbi:MAG: hypothetical protein ACKE8R_05200 [Methylophagaceae bacterium]
MTTNYHHELEEWKKYVGAIILGFGDIELITLKCLKTFPKDNIYNSVATLPLGRRIDLILNILSIRNEEPDIGDILKHLRRVKELSKYRNLLAHNPLMANVYEHQESNKIVVKNLISSIRNGKKAINLAEIEELAAEVEMLTAELWMLISNVTETDQINTKL